MRRIRTKTSERLKEKILEIMEDEKRRNIDEIKKDLEEKGMIFDQDYNINHLSGTLQRLKTQGYVNSLERGVYQKNKEKKPEHDFIYEDTSWKVGDEMDNTNISCLLLNHEADEELKKRLEKINKKLKELRGIDIAKMRVEEKEAFESLLEKVNIYEKLLGEQN